MLKEWSQVKLLCMFSSIEVQGCIKWGFNSTYWVYSTLSSLIFLFIDLASSLLSLILILHIRSFAFLAHLSHSCICLVYNSFSYGLTCFTIHLFVDCCLTSMTPILVLCINKLEEIVNKARNDRLDVPTTHVRAYLYTHTCWWCSTTHVRPYFYTHTCWWCFIYIL